jgi:hypothetical protein
VTVRRASYWTAVAVSVIALFAGSLYAYVAYRETSGPDGTVRGYFAALERSDAASALGFGDTPAGSTDLLTDQVLAEQQAVAPLHDVSIDAVAEHGDRASVQVSYRLHFPSGDRRYRTVLHVVRRDSGWRLTSAVVATHIHIEQAVDRLNFAGTTAPDGRVLMFPGALPIHFDTPYLRVDPTTDSVQFGGARRLDVRIEPTGAARHKLTARLRHDLQLCVRSGRTTIACPVPSPSTIPGSLHGRLSAVRCIYQVTSEASGAISISGNAFFVGRYRTLSYDNVAETHRGRLALPVQAVVYPVAPLAVQFSDST